ncbi:MAG: hypothetical protein EXS14_02435 [Planctomycetes bacterium]|nr:hypothetical protein [Planctomycetota bacterium]
MKNLIPFLAVVMLLSGVAAAQTFTFGAGVVQNTTTGYPAPFGNYWGGARHQFILKASELTAAGASAGNIVSLAFDVVTVNGVPLQGFGVSMGHTAVVPGVATFPWQTGLTTVYGPVLQTAAVGWNTLNFFTPFVWNGVQNVVVETCFNNLTYTQNCIFRQTAYVGQVQSKLYRADNMPTLCSSVLNSSLSGGATWRPNTRLTFGAPPAPNWQVNQVNAYMDFDFVQATLGAPAIVTKCVNGLVNACADSNGMSADIILNTAAIVPTDAGGVALNPANVVNLNLAAGYFQLFGVFAPLGGSTGTCPLYFPTPLGTISAQMIVIDLTAPGFISLSQACQLNGIGIASVTLPNADDVAYTVALGAAPLCHGPLYYYGTSYTQIAVSTNGVISAGSVGVNAYTPSTAAAITNPGSFGIWADFQSNANPLATLVVSQGAFGGVDVTYTNHPYWGTVVNNTFTLALDNFGPRIEGISGLGSDVTSTMLFVSQGGGLATDNGATAFSSGSSGTLMPTNMLYAGPTGGSAAIAGGFNNVWVTFNFGGGLDWLGF